MTLIALGMLFACACGEAADGGAAPEAGPRREKGWPWDYPEDTQLLPVAKDDPHYEAVTAEIARIKKLYRVLEPEFQAPPREIRGDAIEALFPNHRFFFYVWAEKVRADLPANTPRPIAGLLAGRHDAVAIDKEGNVARIGRLSRAAAFGRFLAGNRVKIANPDDAQLVWDAFCEINRRGRKGTIEKVSDKVWRLGITKILSNRGNVFTRYLEVHLTPDLSVESATLWSERPDGSRVAR